MSIGLVDQPEVIQVNRDEHIARLQAAHEPPHSPAVRQTGEGVDTRVAGETLDAAGQFKSNAGIFHHGRKELRERPPRVAALWGGGE